jgi:hypothetical protein
VKRLGIAAGLGLLAALAAGPAAAFELGGHETIEAAAYKRLLALDIVAGTGTPGVSGRTVLATLIATGDLARPPCFDLRHPMGDCRPAQRLDLPLQYWPILGSGTPDLVINRQLGQRGQCQHFMARTADGLTPIDPRFGVPRDLVTAAYGRCIQILGLAFDGILRDPRLAGWRLVGSYALMHGIEDSYSAAHADRDDSGAIVHLLSWKLIDWPRYLFRGHLSFSPDTHHAVTDRRDYDYVRWDARSRDGSPCRGFHEPYALPAECLTERATAATDAVFDYLVMLYRVRTAAIATGRPATLFSPDSDTRDQWVQYSRAHLRSVTETVQVAGGPESVPPLPDLFVGAQVSGGPHLWGTGVWLSRFLVGPAAPFVLGPALGLTYSREAEHGQLVAIGGLGLLLPLVRRVAIGATPAAVTLACSVHISGCTVDVVARLANLIVPLGDATWLSIEGPLWSWTDRRLGATWAGLAVGWSHEPVPKPAPLAPDAVTTWDPPRPEEVRAYRSSRTTRVVYLAATAASRPENQFVGAGLELRLDRDRWNRHAALGPALELEVDAGNIDGTIRGGVVAVAPTARYYLVPDRVAISATPALVRLGSMADRAFAVDVAARAGITFDLAKVEVSVNSPPLSYVAQSRWHGLPITARLGLSFD